MTSVDLEFIHAVITQKGVNELIKVYGKKFTKMFHGFLSSKLLPALEAQIKAEEPAAQVEGGVFEGIERTEVQTSSTAQ